MKNVHSRETLMSIDYYPIEDEVLEQLVDVSGKGSVILLLYYCICHYMNAFAKRYQIPTTCDVEKLFLTKSVLFCEEGMCEFYEEAEYNSSELLYGLAAYCGWDYLCISQEELMEADLEVDKEEVFKEKLDQSELFTKKGKELLAEMSEIIVNGWVYESGTLYILGIKGLRQYLRYRAGHSEIVRRHFGQEDRVIHSIVQSIREVLINNPVLDYESDVYGDNDSDEFLLGWVTGSDGYNYTSISHLNPNWLISMYVLHGLLGHAQAIFGYQLEGDEKR